MQTLNRANQELFRRAPDERCQSLAELLRRCQAQRKESTERWIPPADLQVLGGMGEALQLTGAGQAFDLTDWSFGQLCRQAGVAKETLNRLTVDTAGRVLEETLPKGRKPFQLYTEDGRIRSLHPASYTRLHNAELVEVLMEFSRDFEPPQRAFDGSTGLYLGEQDMFSFLIDPAGWIDIEGQAFAPGFFVWNSEVGRRTVGIQTFWFQAVCANHIVWDATDVVEFTRRHTSKVHEALSEIRQAIERLIAKRDERKDSFARAVTCAMQTDLGHDADTALTALLDRGFARHYAKRAIEIAGENRRFTIFSLVDAMTKLAGELQFAGDRTECDQKASSLLELALSA